MTRWQAAPRRPQPPQWWRFALIAVLVPLALAALATWLSVEQARSDALRTAGQRSAERQIVMVRTLARLADAETSQRGYVITGEPSFLHLYAPSQADVGRMLRDLGRAFDGHADQQRRIAAFTRLAQAKFAEMDAVIAARDREGLRGAAQRVSEGRGKRLMDAARAVAAQIVAAEQRGREAQAAAFERRRRSTVILSWVIVAVTTWLVVTGLLLALRQRRERYAADLRAYEASVRQRTIFDSTVDAIAILNPSGSIETINAAASALTGYDIDELKQRDVSLLFDPPGQEGSFHERIGYTDGQLRQPFLTDRALRTRDGRSVPVDVTLGVMHLEGGDHIVASMRDMTERKRIERMKDELISTVSHELRTPLTSIVGALGLLRANASEPLPLHAAKLVGIAESNSARLIRIINDMLDIDRLDAGKLKVERKRIDLRDVLRRASDATAGLHERGVRVTWSSAAEPLEVEGDGDRLLQVIGNLVSNAVRVSPDGGRVAVALKRTREGARVAVDDKGPGVPEAFRDRIFGRFERAADQHRPGTGLGLAISKEIVGAHGGRIWFEDRKGGGTRFAFVIPFANDAPSVLICESDPALAAKLVSLAEAEGYHAVVATTPEQAQQRIAGRELCAIIVDLDFSEHRGLALARAVREGSEQRDLPIIMLAPDREADWEGRAHVDFVDWLEKPVDPERLASAMRGAISRGGGDASAPTILHLDDDRDMLAVTASALGKDARLLPARTLEEAHAILAREGVTIAIIDLHLETASGLDLLPALVDARGVAIPTILYSGQRVGAEAAAMVDAVLVKAPGSLPDLKATIHRILRSRAAEAGA